MKNKVKRGKIRASRKRKRVRRRAYYIRSSFLSRSGMDFFQTGPLFFMQVFKLRSGGHVSSLWFLFLVVSKEDGRGSGGCELKRI
jgi:hypothetical protein